VFDTVLEALSRLLRPHRLAVVALIDGGTVGVEITGRGGYRAAVDLSGLGRDLAARGVTPDAFAADLARRVAAEFHGREP
jgi:hypothetical protein